MGTATAIRAESGIEEAADYARMERALLWLARHYTAQPSLSDAARAVGLAPHYFQRVFARWVGVSPKQLVQYLTLERAKRALRASRSVLDTSFAAGLSGPGRLHDLFVTFEALSPGEFKRRGEGLRIDYGFHASPFGECLLLATPRGLCGLGFTRGGRERTLADLTRGWEAADRVENPAATRALAARIFRAPPVSGATPLRLLVRGTAFQVQVWKALLRIPPGAVVSYGELARRLGRPRGSRAVATANAVNPISYLIPCHRVIRRAGILAGYRWGPERKLAMLSREAAPVRADARDDEAALGPAFTPPPRRRPIRAHPP